MTALLYKDVRHEFKSGDLIALSHDQWGSWYDLQVQAVRVFTQSEYAHVGLVLVLGGRVWVVESVTPVVRIVPLSLFADDGFYHIPTDTPMCEEEERFALAQVGKGQYSKWQAVLAQLKRLEIGADSLWQCAELFIVARRISGANYGSRATPSAVVRAALSAPGASLRLVTKSVSNSGGV